MSLISKERAADYTRTVVEGSDGKKRRVTDNDDAVARMVRGKNHDELTALAAEHGLTDRWIEWKGRGLNNGQCSMNLRNALRNKFRQEAAEGAKAA